MNSFEIWIQIDDLTKRGDVDVVPPPLDPIPTSDADWDDDGLGDWL